MTVTLWDAIFEDADRMPFGASATVDKHTPGAVDVVLDDYAGTFSRLSLAIRAAKAAAKRRGMTLVTEAFTKYAPTNLSPNANQPLKNAGSRLDLTSGGESEVRRG